MYTYYTKTDDRWYTSYYGQRLRLGSTRLILCLLQGHVLSIVLYFKSGLRRNYIPNSGNIWKRYMKNYRMFPSDTPQLMSSKLDFVRLTLISEFTKKTTWVGFWWVKLVRCGITALFLNILIRHSYFFFTVKIIR